MAKFCEKTLDLDTQTVEFTFESGDTRVLDLTRVPEETKLHLMLHGASQKGGDSYASAKGNTAEALTALDKVIDNLYAGLWTAGRGDGVAKPRTTELAEALARIKGVELGVASAAVTNADEEQRKTWRGHSKVKAVIAQIRAEKAAAKLAKSDEEDIDLG